MNDDIFNKMQNDVSEMKGMLSVVIANHSSRLDAHETHINSLYSQVSSTNSKLGEQAVSLINAEKNIISVRNEVDKNRTESKVSHDKDIVRIEAKQTGQIAKAFAVITPIFSLVVFFIAIGDRIWGGA